MAIKTVGVVGTGVIGASWTALFLAHGLRVLVADPSPDAAEKLSSYLESVWPDLQTIGLSEGASLENYAFVGASLDEHYSKVDYVQEVRDNDSRQQSRHRLTLFARTHQKSLTSKSSCSRRSMRRHGKTSSSPHLRPAFQALNSLASARTLSAY